jgi:nucleoid DNA-binding protein
MAIRYALVGNETMVGKNLLVARVYSAGTIDEEEFVRQISAAGTTVSVSDTVAVVANMEQFVERALADGFNISTGLGTFSIQVKGVFKDYDDRFDASRHEIVVRFRASKKLLKAIQNQARTKKIEPHELRPNLISFRDVVTGQRNSVITPGGIGHIYGNRLKFDRSDPDQGIFLLGENRGVLRVRVVDENQPRKLIFLLPLLPAGAYRLAVRAACCGSRNLETGFLSMPLVVPENAPQLEEEVTFLPASPFLLNG